MRILFIFVAVLIPKLLFAQTIVPTEVDSDLWIKEKNPYVVEADTLIRGTLTIGPGVVVQMGHAYVDSFKVTGSIDVRGTKDEPVIFESYGDEKKNWALNIDSSATSTFTHSVFRNSLNGLIVKQGRVALDHIAFKNLSFCLSVDHAEVDISNTVFTECNDGVIYSEQGNIQLKDSTVTGTSGQGMIFQNHSTLEMNSSTVEGFDNAIMSDNSTVRLRQTSLISNQIGVSTKLSDIEIENSVLRNNGTAISVFKSGPIFSGGFGNMFSPLDKVIVSNSEFVDSVEFDINNTSDITVDARSNWWGSNEGPKKNQGSVLASPWTLRGITCCSNILFIPGFQASRLHLGDNQLWEPNRNADVEKLFLNEKGSSRARVSIGEVIDKGIGYTIYDFLIKELNALPVHWKAFPYDWRRSQSDIATDIIPTLESLATSSITNKVHIVSHSNGGLIAKAVLKQLREIGKEHLIDAMVFIAVPHLGTPKAIASMLYGYDQQIAKGLILNKKIARQFGYNMPGAYGLLPSTYRFPNGGVASSSKDLEQPIALNKTLFNKAKSLHQEIDPITFSKTYSITGWNAWTLDSLSTATKRGDGTVVASSSDIFKDAYYFDLAKFNIDKKKNISHANITEAAPVLALLKNILASTTATQDPYITKGYPTQNTDEILEIKMFSPVDIHVYDSEGRHTGPSLSQKEKELEMDIESDLFTFVDEEIPNSSYSELMDAKIITIPRQGSYTLKGIGTDAGVFTLQTSVENRIIARYEDLPVLKESKIELKINPQKNEELKIDIDNDAVFESSIKPNRKRFMNIKSFLDFCKKILPKLKKHEYKRYIDKYIHI